MADQTATGTDLSNMTTDDIFTSDWLKPEDLSEGGNIMEISKVRLELLPDYNNPEKKNQTIILNFKGEDKQVAANRTRTRSLVSITGSKKPLDWVGWEVLLQKDIAPNSKPTIRIAPIAKPSQGLASNKVEVAY